MAREWQAGREISNEQLWALRILQTETSGWIAGGSGMASSVAATSNTTTIQTAHETAFISFLCTCLMITLRLPQNSDERLTADAGGLSHELEDLLPPREYRSSTITIGCIIVA